MKKIIKYLKPYWPMLLLMVFLLLGQAMAELFLPTLMAEIVNEGIVPSIEEGINPTPFILRTGGFMLFIALLAGSASITAAYIAPRISAGAARDMRRDLFVKVENFSQGEFDKFSSASLITRCTNDVAQVQNLANVTARLLLYAPLMGIGGVIMALSRSVSMSWIIALAVIVLMGFIAILITVLMNKFKILQEMVDKLNKIAREILHGLMVIRAFGTQRHEKKRFDKINTDLKDTGLFIGRVMAFAGPLITFVMGGTQILVIWVGAHHVANSGLPIGDMMAFMQYAMQVIIAFMMMSFMIIMVPRALVSASRIAEVLDTDLIITDPKNPKTFSGENTGLVEFDNVSFRYPGAETDVISEINFCAYPGQTTAIIGATGSGKSTMANLLLRFYDVTQGQITVDGIDIRQVKQEDLRQKIGYVPQKGQLIGGTIASNIRYGKTDATDEELAVAAKVAQALDFIEEKEDKYESEITQGGTNVSGGQRQRISIARALARNPEIIVFDDSFSALDFTTDAKLRKALKEHTANATVIVIAQRVGTIMNAEQILVLDEGKIVGQGTHEELLTSCPAYHEIASSQGTI